MTQWEVKRERLLESIAHRRKCPDPPIPSDLPGRTPSTILAKPNGINGYSRLLSGTPTSLEKSTTHIPPGALLKKKSKDVSSPDSPAIIRTANWMGSFKTADDELEVEEQNIESRLREFILKVPDEL